MILDTGICSIYSVSNSAASGNLPKPSLTLRCQSWYGELEFATSPLNTDNQEAIEVSARIRVVQNRAIQNHDVVVIGSVQYDITRAFHGTDDENGQPITDLTLSRLVNAYDIS